MNTSKILCSIIAALAMLLAARSAPAQFGVDESQPDMWTRPKGNVENVEIKGKIVGMQRDVVQLANEQANQRWLVKMPREANGVRVYGTARLNYLQPGMMVRFSGVFDLKGNAQAPIERLEVFTPKPAKEGMVDPQQFGVFAEEAFGARLLQNEAPGTQPKLETGSFVVSGQLRGFRKGELFVAAGPTLVRVPLSEKAEISTDVTDTRWVQVGDEMEVSGWSYPYLKTHVVATRVTIHSSHPMGPAPEEKPAKPAAPKAPEAKPEPPVTPRPAAAPPNAPSPAPPPAEN